MPHLAIRIQFSVSGIMLDLNVLNRLPAHIVPYSFSVTKVRHFFTLEHVRSVPVQVLSLLRYITMSYFDIARWRQAKVIFLGIAPAVTRASCVSFALFTNFPERGSHCILTSLSANNNC